MLAVSDAQKAASWYGRALGAERLWDLGSVVGLVIEGAPVFLGQPENNGWDTPSNLGNPSVRGEIFTDDPDGFVARACGVGAEEHPIRNHEAPWGVHRQGGFVDPFGHLWFVGDRSPLQQQAT